MTLNAYTQAQKAAKTVRSLILNGTFKPGQPLRQDALSDQLMVSRTPLRQALQMLSEEGLVRITGFKGAQVAPINSAQLDDLFDMRFALEPMALDSALTKLTKLDLAAAEMALDKAVGIAAPAALSQFNWEFHSALYAPSGRVMLLETIKRLNRTSALAEVIAHSIIGRAQQSHDEHLLLLEACRRNDPPLATKILKQHLTLAHKTAKSTLKD